MIFTQPKKRRCGGCPELIVLVAGERPKSVFGLEEHPAGYIRLDRRGEGWVAHVMTVDEMHRAICRRYVNHFVTCRRTALRRVRS